MSNILRLIIDGHLSWHDHIENTCTKISKNINVMPKVKRFLGEETAIIMYLSLIYPYLTYGNNYENPLYDDVNVQSKLVRID